MTIRGLAEELSSASLNTREPCPAFSVAVEGTPRNLHPVLRHDIYRLAGEALRNAFRHAAARHIKAEIRYEEKQLQPRVRDDGRGIDSGLLEDGKPGRFGLSGMRERAALIGGRLDVCSQPGIGTEVDLRVPGYAVYAAPRAQHSAWSIGGGRSGLSEH